LLRIGNAPEDRFRCNGMGWRKKRGLAGHHR
jgi:hypothetical protein